MYSRLARLMRTWAQRKTNFFFTRHRATSSPRSLRYRVQLLLVMAVVAPECLQGEDGHNAWLRYAPIRDVVAQKRLARLPAVVVRLDDSPVAATAQQEIIRGVRGMLGRTLRAETSVPDESAIILGTFTALRNVSLRPASALKPDGYWLKSMPVRGPPCLVIAASSDRGVLYGAFAFLRKIALEEPVSALDAREEPFAPLRWVNQWDNLDGAIERGYGGRSIFWEDGRVVDDLTRAATTPACWPRLASTAVR